MYPAGPLAEYPEIGTAFWYILQTITTVGYGDVTPTEPIGQLIGAIFMMLGIAVLAILTASITSAFLDAKQAERRDQQDATRDDDQARLRGSPRRTDRATDADGGHRHSTGRHRRIVGPVEVTAWRPGREERLERRVVADSTKGNATVACR